jgi:hypothetical protein
VDQYSIPLTGVNYNTDARDVQPGFSGLVQPVQSSAAIRFAVGDINYAKH